VPALVRMVNSLILLTWRNKLIIDVFIVLFIVFLSHGESSKKSSIHIRCQFTMLGPCTGGSLDSNRLSSDFTRGNNFSRELMQDRLGNLLSNVIPRMTETAKHI
jgi:hypothetical protein